MISEKEIQHQLNNEYQKFIKSKYEGEVNAPENIIELFKKAILILPPFVHKINFGLIKTIAGYKVNELHNEMISNIIKAILNVSLEKLYEGDFDSIIKHHQKFEKFVISFNNYIDEFQKKLQMKKATLESLSGRNNGNMQIVSN